MTTAAPKLTKPQREIVEALVNGTLLFNIDGRRKAVDSLVRMGFVRRILVDWCVGADKDGKPYKVYFKDNVTKATYVEFTAEGEDMFK